MTPHTLSFRDLVEATAAEAVLPSEIIFDMEMLEEGAFTDMWKVVWEFFKGLVSGGIDRASVIEQFREAGIDSPAQLHDELKKKRDDLEAIANGVSKDYPKGYEEGREVGRKLVGGAMWLGTLPLRLASVILGKPWENKFWEGGLILWVAATILIALVPGGTTSLAALATGQFGGGTYGATAATLKAAEAGTLPWLMKLAPYQIVALMGAVTAAIDSLLFRLSELMGSSAEEIRAAGETELGAERRPSIKTFTRTAHKGAVRFKKLIPHREAWVYDEDVLIEAVMAEGLEDLFHKITQKVLIPFQGFLDGFKEDPAKLTELSDFIQASGITNETTIDTLVRARGEEYMQKLDQMGFAGQVLYKLAVMLGDMVRKISDATIVPMIKILKRSSRLRWLEEDFHLHLFAMFAFGVFPITGMWLYSAAGATAIFGVPFPMAALLSLLGLSAAMQMKIAGFRTIVAGAEAWHR